MAKGRVRFKTNFDKAARKINRIADDLPSDLSRDLEPYFKSVVGDAKSTNAFNDNTTALRKSYRKSTKRRGKTATKTNFEGGTSYWEFIEFGTAHIRERKVIQDALNKNDSKLISILRKYGKIRGR